MALTLTRQHTPHEGVVAGGVISALADTALIFAGGSALGVPVGTAEYPINYVRRAQGTELVARANAVATTEGRAICRCGVGAIPDGQEVRVAVAQGTIVPQAAASG